MGPQPNLTKEYEVKRNKAVSSGIGLLVALTGTFGLAACGSSGEPGNSATTRQAVDVAGDLETARQAVIDALAKKPGSAQVMLASDVKQPTEKYGLLVMPFVKSDAAKKVTGTVNIAGGKYTIEAVSAATGDKWQIDQDGVITQVEK